MKNQSNLPRLVASAFAILIFAWVFSLPAGTGPDEAQHYLKAFAAGGGDLLLEELPPPLGTIEGTRQRQKAVRFMGRQTRMVSIPARLSPEAFSCRAFPGRLEPCPENPAAAGREVELGTYVGTYPPWPYLLPGLVMRLGATPTQALLAARISVGVASAGLLALALGAAWGGRRPYLAVLGPIAATSPMVLFVSSTLSGSGLEVASSICFLACLLRLARTSDGETAPAPGWVWAAAGVSGALLATTRDLGPLWVVLHCALIAGFIGIRRIRAAARSGARPAVWSIAVIAAATLAGTVWALAVQVRPRTDIGAVIGAMDLSRELFSRVVREQIGVFGPLDTPMPPFAYWTWALMLAALAGAGLLLGSTRQRLSLAAAGLVTAVLTSAFDAVQDSIGFDAQGRHLLPLAIAIPLLAAEMAAESQRELPPPLRRAWPLLFAGVAASVQALAWFTIARRYSVGLSGPVTFWEASRWSPPLGWLVWAAAAAAGTALLGASGLLSSAGAKGERRKLS